MNHPLPWVGFRPRPQDLEQRIARVRNETARTHITQWTTKMSTEALCKDHPRHWVVRSDPFYPDHSWTRCNPTHGSGWFIRILSTPTTLGPDVIPPTAVGGSFRFFLKNLNNPPTTVGGIPRLSFCWL